MAKFARKYVAIANILRYVRDQSPDRYRAIGSLDQKSDAVIEFPMPIYPRNDKIRKEIPCLYSDIMYCESIT
jgi:hypothetical protein